MVRVIRDFLTLNDGELSVIKDEILQIVQVVDRHWVRCQNVRDVGLVPSSNICPIGIKMIQFDFTKKYFIFISFFEIDNLPHAIEKGHAILVAESNFNAENEGDLSIQKGDLIIGLETVDQAWTKGRNLQGQVGIFPTSFCWTPNTDLLFKTKSKVSYSCHKK